MEAFMDYAEARAFIDRVAVKGNELGLETITNLLELLGNPQDELKFIHVAGTNGKGSVLAYLYTVLQEAGYTVGRYISPTLFSYRERIQIGEGCATWNADREAQKKKRVGLEEPLGTEYISREDFAECASMAAAAYEEMGRRGMKLPTVFEVETAISFLYFKKRACDLVLLEVGMGGRLDATNIIRTPVLTVLASISMDHMEFLGDTLAEIAWNKAGILKPGIPVASASQLPEAEQVIREEAVSKGCAYTFVRPEEITDVQENIFGSLSEQSGTVDNKNVFRSENSAEDSERSPDRLQIPAYSKTGNPAEGRKSCEPGFQSFVYDPFGRVEIALAGPHQRENAALALECIGILRQSGYTISDEAVREGLRKTEWKGRFSVIHRDPLVIIDGAHNPDAARVLRRSIEEYFPKQKKYYIFGVFSDKEYDKIIEITAGLAEHIFAVETPDNPRALPVQELAKAVSRVNPSVEAAESIAEAVRRSFQMAEPDDVILAFGSLSFLAEAERAVRLYAEN